MLKRIKKNTFFLKEESINRRRNRRCEEKIREQLEGGLKKKILAARVLPKKEERVKFRWGGREETEVVDRLLGPVSI